MLITHVSVPARRIRLPNLDERVWDRASVAVENTSADNDAFTERLTRMLNGQIVIFFSDLFMSIDWTRNLRQGVRQHNQRS